MNDQYVLDTHAWVNYVTAPGALPRRARRLTDTATVLHVPAICLREVAVHGARDRLRTRDPKMTWDEWMMTALADPCAVAPLTPRIAIESAGLEREGFHGDPADQMIYATARVLGIPVITRDRRIHEFEARLPRKAMRLAVWD